MLFNPSRLSLARRRRGLTKRALAEAARLGERTIVAYERGDRKPARSTIKQLARVLGFPGTFFARPDLERIPGTTASFRGLSRMTAAQRARALAGGELALELNEWIEERFMLPKPDLPDLRPQLDPESAAAALRVEWGLADKPVQNVIHLLEAKGIRVYSLAEECYEVDAFSFWQGPQPFVFLNTMKSAERSRFDAAHELGHLILHRHGQPTGREAEREADLFASAFLMPRTSILAYGPRMPTIQNLIRAKQNWQVAVFALAYRMHAIGMITDWHYRSLCIEMQRLGYRRVEPEGTRRELSQVLAKVFGALRAEGTRETDLARSLDWPISELKALVFRLVLASEQGGNQSLHLGRPSAKQHLRIAR